MWRVQWDHPGILFISFLKHIRKLNAYSSVQQLQRVYKCLVEKQPALTNMDNFVLPRMTQRRKQKE